MKERRVMNELSRTKSGSSPNILSKQQSNATTGQHGNPIEERRGSAIRISDLTEQERKSRHTSVTELVVKGRDKHSWGECYLLFFGGVPY
jgi:hypothetical protein